MSARGAREGNTQPVTSYERNAIGVRAREEQKRITGGSQEEHEHEWITRGARTQEECEKSTSTGGAREPRTCVREEHNPQEYDHSRD